jgi:sugar lactone lactonase YvrE
MVLVLITACALFIPEPEPEKSVVLEPVAFSDLMWTGVALSDEGRIFVNYPRFGPDLPVSVAELVQGLPVPYPNIELNSWTPEKDPAVYLICVQSVFIDDKDRLWILDPANPGFQGVVPGGPKLLQVDLATNSVVQTFNFGPEIAPPNSYLNDVRIDTQREFAFMTDSGAVGAIIVLNLQTGEVRRVLNNHRTTTAEDIVLTVGGAPFMLGGQTPRLNSDGIAYDKYTDTLYYQALTGRTMYRITASSLRESGISDREIEEGISIVGKTGAADGLIVGPDGKVYISALEKDAILRTTRDGEVETVIQDPAISWPDSFSFGPDGKLYFTTARIHELGAPTERFGLYRIDIDR